MVSPTTDRRLGLVGNIAMKAPVTVLAAANITLSGQQTIDGIAVLASNASGVPDRVLCTGQTDATQNGIWDVSTAAWTRSLDANGNYDFGQGSTVLINRGSTYAGTYWKIATTGAITIGTTSLSWTRSLASSIDTQSFLQAGTGAVSRGVQDKMREVVNAADYSGVDSTGATNSTTGLKNFFDYCIASGRPGHINAGTYKVTTGILVFDTPFVDAIWPHITTDGHQAVTFSVDAATATNAPILSLTNGTATSGAGKYWRGGSIGGITFSDATGAAAPARHGLSLRGVWATKIGWIVGNDLRGSAVSVPALLFGGTNPDPYAVTFVDFEAIEANRCARYGLENQNYVGLNGCTVRVLRVISGVLGGWFGLGAGNTCIFASIGSTGGWAFDDGTNAASTGGSPSRFRLVGAELDDVQNGFRINKLNFANIEQTRFIHRFNFSALNPAGGYWPRKAIEFNGGVAPAALGIAVDLNHRIEAGGVKADMGVFLDFTSVACTNIAVDQRVIDNASFGFVNSDLVTNLSVSSSVNLSRDGTLIADKLIDSTVYANGDGTTAILNSGWGTAAAKVLMPVERSDRRGAYASSQYTAPYTGLYHCTFRFQLNTAAVGTLIRMGFMRDRGGALTTVAYGADYSQTANNHTYQISGLIDLVQGDIIYPIANQNTGTASIACTVVISQAADNVFQVRAA